MIEKIDKPKEVRVTGNVVTSSGFGSIIVAAFMISAAMATASMTIVDSLDKISDAIEENSNAELGHCPQVETQDSLPTLEVK